MKLRFLLAITSVLFSSVNVFAQSVAEGQKIRAVIPPAPTAAALGAYAEYPSDGFSGVPGISVPLYELKLNGFTLPISLSYNASGIKVGEVASWVGLGWSLNAGGVITRSVNRFLRESLLMGPRGGVMVESIWEESRLITIKLIGGL